jgi:hypothetical protein
MSDQGTVIIMPIASEEDTDILRLQAMCKGQEIDYGNLPQLLMTAPLIIICTIEDERYHLKTLTQGDYKVTNLIIDHALENIGSFHPIGWTEMTY